MTHTADAEKVITKAVPTVNEDGLVIKWDIDIKYSFNGYESTFHRDATVEPTLVPTSWNLDSLWDLVNKDHLDTVFESQYESVMLAPAPTDQRLDEFDVNSLS